MQLGTLRVECEKAEAEGGDESWQRVGEHALASLAIVRAYRERALHLSYSGALPPSAVEPHQPAGEVLHRPSRRDVLPSGACYFNRQLSRCMHPCAHAAGAPAAVLNSEEERLLAALAPAALPRSAPAERVVVHTDLELLQALRALRCLFAACSGVPGLLDSITTLAASCTM